jgi:hypothetical protein
VQFYVNGALVDTETLSGTSPYTAASTYTFAAAGSYNIVATYVPGTDQEFAGSSSAVTVTTVNLIAPTITWLANPQQPIVYGTPLSAVQLTATAADPVTLNAVTGTFAYVPAAGFVLPAGTDNLQANFTPDPSVATIYSSNSSTESITVTQAALTVTPDNQTMVYGAAVPTLTYTFSGLVAGDVPSQVTGQAQCSITGTMPYTVSGSPYPITCALGSLTEPNYTFSFATGSTLTVTTATPTLTMLCPAATYDGTAHGCAGVAVGADGTTQVAGNWTYSPGSETNVGSYPETGTFVSTDTDYSNGGSSNNGQATGTLVIGLATSSVTLTCPASVIYTGSAQTPCSATATGDGGLNVTNLTVTYSNNTNPGVATATATYAGDANHTGSSNTVNFAISNGSALATAGTLAPTPYTGAPIPIPACQVTPPVPTGGPTCTNNPVNAGPDVGTGTVTPVWVGNTAGYTLLTANGSWTITPAATTVTVTCLASVVYNGAAQTPCTAVVSGPGTPPQTVTWTYTPQNTNVGPVTATATFAASGDYGASSGSNTFQITPATATMTLNNLTQYFTGSPAMPVTANTLPTGLTYSVLYGTTGDPTDATSPNPPTATGSYAVLAQITNSDYCDFRSEFAGSGRYVSHGDGAVVCGRHVGGNGDAAAQYVLRSAHLPDEHARCGHAHGLCDLQR